MSNPTPAQSFEIEHNHSDEQIAEFAARCGCPKCERYRASHVEPASTVRQAIPVMSTTPAPAVGSVPPGVPATTPVRAATALGCRCPLGTRPACAYGMPCPWCGQLRTRQVATAPRSMVRDLDANRNGQATDEAAQMRAHVAALEAQIAELKRQEQRSRTFVAGASSVAAGKFFGFEGLGQMTRAQLVEIVTAVGLPESWILDAKSAHAQAGVAVAALNRSGYVVRSVRVPKKAPINAATGREEVRGWRARWQIAAAVGGGEVGAAFGSVVCTATLTTAGDLVLEGPDHLTAKIRAEYDGALATSKFEANDVTSWLAGIIIGKFRGVRVGGNWYVRGNFAKDCERLCTALAKKWGRSWLLPALPMAASNELAEGIVSSFTADAQATLDTYRAERDAVDEKTGKATPIGKRRAASLLGEIRELMERAAGFATMFGPNSTAKIRAALVAAAEEIQGSTDDISTRFGLIFDELVRDGSISESER